jgi:precorrin-8X/cobalt-precorrin-8 methylmutase
LLPDLSTRSEAERALISNLVLAAGDISLAGFIRFDNNAFAASRNALESGCNIIADIPTVASAFDQTRLAHLGCRVETLIDNPHISTAIEAENAFWQNQQWHTKLKDITPNSIIIIGYAPSILLAVCKEIQLKQIQPALVIGMPIGFSHAPAAKRQIIQSGTPYLTIEGSLGGGLLAATALNTLTEWVIEKPDCHCYLKGRDC